MTDYLGVDEVKAGIVIETETERVKGKEKERDVLAQETLIANTTDMVTPKGRVVGLEQEAGLTQLD